MGTTLQRWEHHFALPKVALVTALAPLTWLRAGWADMRARPGPSLIYGLLFALGGWAIFGLGIWRPYLFTLAASGFFLVAPLLAAGLYELSRRHEAGEPMSFTDSLSCWRRNATGLAMFGVLLAVVAIAWERLTAIIFALLGSGVNPPDPAMFMLGPIMSGEDPWLTAVWVVLGAAVAAAVFVVSAVSVPMMVDRQVDFATAIATSVTAVSVNAAAMAVWAVWIVGLTLIGMATLMIGIVVVVPLLGHATWHAYRALVARGG